MILPADVRDAARILDGVVHRTEPVTSRTLGDHIVLKPENLQRGGSFKLRGAYTKISSLPAGEPVVAYSSGNHAQAVAIAAGLLGSQATILMPTDAPASKVAATRAYGADIVTYDRYTEDRDAIGAALAVELGAELVRPYDDEHVMAGAGTAALELIEDAGALDVLVVPVGGGGLISGSATIAKSLGVARVIGVEPAAGNDWARSLAAGRRIAIDVPRTIADGLQASTPGEQTWPVAYPLVDEIVTVTDEQIVDAMRFAFERLKLVVEPSGAVGIAAVRERLVEGGRIGVIVSGGNVGATRFAELIG